MTELRSSPRAPATPTPPTDWTPAEGAYRYWPDARHVIPEDQRARYRPIVEETCGR